MLAEPVHLFMCLKYATDISRITSEYTLFAMVQLQNQDSIGQIRLADYAVAVYGALKN